MTPRDRYLEAILFGKPDRIPLTPGMGRRSTIKAWREQGLPEDVRDVAEYAYRQVGGELEWPHQGEWLPLNSRMIPEFEEKVLEVRGDTQIVQDWKGNICEISSEYSTEHLRNAIDFVTRRWIKCPVESREDWESMKTRYNANDPARWPADLAEQSLRWKTRTAHLLVHFSGPFWQLREWLGFEGLCYLLKDDPGFVREMIEFWSDFMAQLLERTFEFITPDIVYISEDMAYKSFSMVSPEMTREFLQPTWRRWGDMAKAAGCPVYMIDSDGYVGELIPIWIDSGFHCCDPMEVAAGNDLVAYRETYGKRMAYRGGVDKRAMARGGQALEDEMARLEPVIRSGGYIPSCDHGVPSDVSWANYLHYVRLLARLTGWL